MNDWYDKDGNLFSLGKYLWWQKGLDYGTLDGDFSIEELEFIVKYAKENYSGQKDTKSD